MHSPVSGRGRGRAQKRSLAFFISPYRRSKLRVTKILFINIKVSMTILL